VEQLLPGTRYHVSGALGDDLTADHQGHGTIVVDLHDRTEITLTPAA
jgi:hypothetical protein